MNTTDYVISKIYELVPGTKTRHKDRINFRCIFCGDSKKSKSKKRAWYYYLTSNFHCFNCNTTTNMYNFLSKLESRTINEIKIDLFKQQILGKQELLSDIIVRSPVKEIEENNNLDKFEIPSTWLDYNQVDIAKIMVERRKIMEAPFLPDKKWKPYYDSKSSRLILPWLKNGNIIYYQARKLYENQMPKYLFPDGKEKPVCEVNYNSNIDFITLHEGILDAIYCVNSIVIGGIHATSNQMAEIDKYHCKKIWLFDNQWVDKTSFERTKALLAKNEHVFIWDKNIREKDINDFVIAKNKNYFSNPEYILQNTYQGAKGMLKLLFNK